MPEAIAKPTETNIARPRDTSSTAASIEVDLTFKIDLRLLRRQKRALIDIRRGSPASADQEDAVEGS